MSHRVTGLRILALVCVWTSLSQAQPIYETLMNYDPQATTSVINKNLPTDWFLVRFSTPYPAQIDSAIIGFGIQKSSSTAGQLDTIIVKLYDSPLQPLKPLDSFVAAIPANLSGQIPDNLWVIEFIFDGFIATVNSARDFYLAWKISGPPADIARIQVKKPAVNAIRSIVLPQTGIPINATPYFFPNPQQSDSVDFLAETHVNFYNGVPVELLQFSTSLEKGAAVLTWKTASETNNRGFIIERAMGSATSERFRLWQRIGSVPGQGTTSEPHSYRFVDLEPWVAASAEGNVLYRLKQEDFDGTITTSAVQSLQVASAEGWALDPCWPNPARGTDRVHISYRQSDDETVLLRLVDLQGQERLVRTLNTSAGAHLVPIDLPMLPAGTYYLLLTAGERRLVRSFRIID